MDLVALGALLAGPLVFLDAKGQLFDLDLLQDANRLVGVDQLAAATGAAGVVMDPRGVDFARLEGLPLMAIVAGLGCLVIGVLNNGLFLLDVSPFWQQVVNGCVILAAVAIDRMSARES